MLTPISLFDYDLPPERIAQCSVEPRDCSRLMVLDRASGAITHRSFFEVGAYLRAGDVLVLNASKVFKARLRGRKEGGTIGIEVTLLRPVSGLWEAMVYPGRRLRVGTRIAFRRHAAVVERKADEGVTFLRFSCSDEDVFALCEEEGEIPVPPYVQNVPEELASYQTVYAKARGSVAAPTAGFHFTARLLAELRDKGVQIEEVTLHVGIGTFQPMKADVLEEHVMHREFVQIDAQTAERIAGAKQEGRRIIACGTTTVRALEGSGLPVGGFVGDVNTFITPGFSFKIIDGLITNFHLPKSTLLVLVSALAGRDHTMRAYREAIEERYRFFSFGDAMLIL